MGHLYYKTYMSYEGLLLYGILLLPCFCGMYVIRWYPWGGWYWGHDWRPLAGERENNGLDVAIILDPPGLNCPKQQKICVRAKLTDCYFNTDGYCKL